MKATIRISTDEIAQMIRERILKIDGVDKVTGITPVTEYDHQDENADYIGHDITVELKEKP